MPAPNKFGDLGLILDLCSAWSFLVFSKAPPPVKCERCHRTFSDGFGITGDLATGLKAQIYCERCYSPFIDYIDSRDEICAKGEPMSVADFLKQRDEVDPEATEKDIQACFQDRKSSSLVIVAPKKKKAEEEKEKEGKEAIGGSDSISMFDDKESIIRTASRSSLESETSNQEQKTTTPKTRAKAIAPFVNIGESLVSLSTSLGTLVATDARLSSTSLSTDNTLRVPSPSTPPLSRSSSLSLSRNLFRRRSSSRSQSLATSSSGPGRSPVSYIGATLLRAGNTAMHIAVQPRPLSPDSGDAPAGSKGGGTNSGDSGQTWDP